MATLLTPYNTQKTFYFSMVKRGVVDLAQSADWTPATGDTKISKDGGTLGNTTNNPAIVAGTNGVVWSLTLTATELSCARASLQIVDTATKAVEDQFFDIATYGNASAAHVFDLGTASTAQTGDSFARIGAPVGASISADVAAVPAATWAVTMVEPTAAPAVTGTMKVAVAWLLAKSVNRKTQTATTATLRNNANSGDISTSTVSDDATTAVSGKWT